MRSVLAVLVLAGASGTDAGAAARSTVARPETVFLRDSAFTLLPSKERCRSDIDYHTTVTVAGWPSTASTHILKWRVLLSDGRISAQSTAMTGRQITLHSRWHGIAPFALTLKFEVTYPGHRIGEGLTAHAGAC